MLTCPSENSVENLTDHRIKTKQPLLCPQGKKVRAKDALGELLMKSSISVSRNNTIELTQPFHPKKDDRFQLGYLLAS